MVLLCIRVNAEEVTQSENSVYASAEKQEQIAAAFTDEMLDVLKEEEVVILKESITPVYFIDPVECLESGEIVLRPGDYPIYDNVNGKLKDKYDLGVGGWYMSPVLNTADESTQVYVAKSVKYNRSAACSWVICLDESGNIKCFTKMKGSENTAPSYADHKDTIDLMAEKLGMEISHKDLTYVRICGIDTGINEYFDYGSAYYYNKDGVEMLIMCKAYDLLFGDDIYLEGDEIFQRFQLLKEKREDEIAFKEKYGIDLESEYIETSERMCTLKAQHITHVQLYIEEDLFSGSMPDPSRVIGEIVVHNDVEAPSQTEAETEKPDIDLEQSEKADTKNENSIDIFDVCGILSVIILVTLIVLTLIKKREKTR